MNSEMRKDCPMRHPDNGNCLPAGGFCTAVNNIICEALHSAFFRGYVSASEKYTEVVRCKDCKHRENEVLCPMYFVEVSEFDEGDGYMATDYITHDRTVDDGYCHKGERKEGE